MNLLRMTIFLLLLPYFLCSQAKDGTDLSGRFHLNLGAEYRVTPVYSRESRVSEKAFFTNFDMQNSGFGILVGGEFYFTNNLSVGISGSLRNDLLVFDPPTEFNDFSQNENKKLMLGLHLDLNYYFQLFKKGNAFIGGGISFLNRNSNYTTEDVFFNEDGTINRTETVSGDYGFTASKLSIGYGLGNSKISIGIYLARKTPYFREPTTFIIPQIRFKYDLAKFNFLR